MKNYELLDRAMDALRMVSKEIIYLNYIHQNNQRDSMYKNALNMLLEEGYQATFIAESVLNQFDHLKLMAIETKIVEIETRQMQRVNTFKQNQRRNTGLLSDGLISTMPNMSRL